MAAARWWARGGKPAVAKPSAGASKVAADLAAFGAPKGLVGRWSAVADDPRNAEEDAGLFKVRPDCWDTVRLFCLLETQWAWVGAGLVGASRTGLRYEAVGVTARLSRTIMTPTLFDGLRTMEIAALDEMATIAAEDVKRRKRDGGTPKATRRTNRGK